MPVYTRLDRFQRASLPKRFAAWINPRCFRWRLPGLLGGMAGLALISAEFLSEGTPSLERALLLVAVFVCLEFFGVMIGYGSLARSLHLFRNDRALFHELAAPSAPVPARYR